jgi:hypothetical protein
LNLIRIYAIQHRGVFALFSGFEFNANLDAIQHTGVFASFFGFEFPNDTPTNQHPTDHLSNQ